MLYIPIDLLKPGMLLARDLPGNLFYLSLLTAGQELTAQAIEKLRANGIQGAYVESSFCGDMEIKEVIDPAFKKELLRGIQKQFSQYLSRTLSSMDMYKAFSSMAIDIVSYILSKDDFLFSMIDIRDYDSYTFSHSLFVGLIGALMGIKMELPKTQIIELTMSGLLHDLGKLDVPREIINKPGKLNDEEFEIIKQHPQFAVRQLSKTSMYSPAVLNGILSHHEKFDGTGYPKGLAGKDIPLYGRVLALADVFDALISKRAYRAGWMPGQAVEYIMSCCNSHFDQDIMQVFLSVVCAYPSGTFVHLSNGCLAVVVSNTPGQTLRPTVRILSPADRRGEEIDLAADKRYLNTTIVGSADANTDISSAFPGLQMNMARQSS